MICKSKLKSVDLGLNASHNFLLSGKSKEAMKDLLAINNSFKKEDISIWIHQLQTIFKKIGHNVFSTINLINHNSC